MRATWPVALAAFLSAQAALGQTVPVAIPTTPIGATTTPLPPATTLPPVSAPPATTLPPTSIGATVTAPPAATVTTPAAGATATLGTPPTTTPADNTNTNGQWRGTGTPKTDNAAAPAPDALQPIAVTPRRPIASVSQGPASLPNEQGQVWREYDISPYTVRVTSTNRPEQAIVDWILRETGYEAWHSDPLGILSANRRSLKVYHTPEMHAVVSEIVDRFVSSEAETQAFGMRVVTVGSPNWRAKVHPKLVPVSVQTQGIQAWLVYREDAAWILAELRKRIDFREHSSPQLLINNGQSSTVTSTRTRTYVRDAIPRPELWPPFAPDNAPFDEGFSLELNPLLGLDGRTVDAVIKCHIDQLEKLVPVTLEIQTQVAQRQRTRIEVPQASHCRFQERFRWPSDKVLVVGLGVAPPPVPTDPHPLLAGIPGLNAAPRADLLVFIDCKGKILPTTTTNATPTAYAPAGLVPASGSPTTAIRDSRQPLR